MAPEEEVTLRSTSDGRRRTRYSDSVQIVKGDLLSGNALTADIIYIQVLGRSTRAVESLDRLGLGIVKETERVPDEPISLLQGRMRGIPSDPATARFRDVQSDRGSHSRIRYTAS